MVDFEEDIKKSMQVLQNGGVILYPTDTIWGLGCDATNETAIEKVFSVKQRPKEKSLILLLADTRDIMKYVAAPPPDIISILESFDTPTTVIYDSALDLPDNVVNQNGSIAIRVTNDPFCRALIKRLRKPIVSTSANLSGGSTPSTFSMISPVIIEQADYVVKYRREDATVRPPSRIIRMDDNGEITQLR